MRLSMHILEHALSPHVIFRQFPDAARRTLGGCVCYEPGQDRWPEDLLTLILPEELSRLEEVPDGACLLCCGDCGDLRSARFRRAQLLAVDLTDLRQALNLVLAAFRTYEGFSRRFSASIEENASLQSLVDLSTELLQQPLCLLDLNHNILAISSFLDSPDDPLWEAMRDGYGYSHYDLVAHSEPKVEDMIQTGRRTVEQLSNISGHSIRVSLLYRDRDPVAAVGMHRCDCVSEPYPVYLRQLFDYVTEKLSLRLSRTSALKPGRGAPHEQFLTDLLEGRLTDEDKIAQYSRALHLESLPRHILALVLFPEGEVKTSRHFAMMDYIETILPGSKCVMTGSAIAVLYDFREGCDMPDQLQQNFSVFLSTHGCSCLMSGLFRSLTDLSRVQEQLRAALPLIPAADRQPGSIIRLHALAQDRAVRLLGDTLPVTACCHPLPLMLLEQDRQTGSGYYQTFSTYLRCGCNVSTAAQSLHMHRNTLLYRIKKIEDLFGGSFDDAELREQLLFSLRCLDAAGEGEL